MALRSCALAFGVALLQGGCADGLSPVTAEKLLEVAGLRAVVNAVALSPDGGVVVVGDLALPASTVALLRPGDEQGRGPYGLEVWRLTYQTKQISAGLPARAGA
jgi:hypothetical protein